MAEESPSVLNEILEQLKELKRDNQALKEQLNQRETSRAADGIRVTRDTARNLSGLSPARSVTIRTRPVGDAPEDYLNVVDPVSAPPREEDHD